jgi:FtsP/CotA-like multicopper oxidase with cupredoxin domain
MRCMQLKSATVSLLLLAMAFSSSQAFAATVTYNLRAELSSITMPDNSVVPVWGFADDTAGANTGVVTVPGPQLKAAQGDTLVINLSNRLSVPISIIIPGQRLTPSPTSVGGRVMSFANEVAAGATGTLTFTPLKTGTFLYESGTNPAIQLNMGLFGSLVVNPATAGQAYPPTITNPGTLYDQDAVLLFSDILGKYDTAQNKYVTYNQDVADGKNPNIANYNPIYYLINGKSFPDTLTPGLTAPPGSRTLLRLLNASGHDYMPAISGTYFDNLTPPEPHAFSPQVIAEDGNLYRYAKPGVAMLLPAGKTLDAMLDLTGAAVPGYYAVYDRRLGQANAGSFPGGMLTFIASWGPTENCSPLKGDVNGDGLIDFVDVMAVLRLYLAGGSNPNGDVFPVSVSGLPCGNGTLDLSDALLLLQKAAGFTSY